ncbi:hypothetical protein GCM10018965_050400 [Nonomuraea roseola]
MTSQDLTSSTAAWHPYPRRFGDESEVDGSRPEHADPLNGGGELGVEGEHGVVALGGALSDAVVAEGHYGIGQLLGVGGADRLLVAPGAEPVGGPGPAHRATLQMAQGGRTYARPARVRPAGAAHVTALTPPFSGERAVRELMSAMS